MLLTVLLRGLASLIPEPFLILCGLVLLGLDWMPAYPLYLLGVSVVALCFGGYPAAVADYYRTRHMGVNYGFLFTAYGAGGLEYEVLDASAPAG